MKIYKFTVGFVGPDFVEVLAGGAVNAVILACAKRIEAGLHIRAFSVSNMDTGETFIVDSEKPIIVDLH